ncbi:MAG TPA: autotransporter-associated beta strand repeat-containing protein, partial [Lacipirellulaceae bacterium]|nr:autotransporter-associated beta strand repeat-containing protein [Lacipirellulaceae bacterium]
LLNADGVAHQNDLIAIQVGDEQQSDIEDPNGYTQSWFAAAHAGNYFPNTLLYTNSFFIANQTNYTNYIANANPDAISWDSYPFANPAGYYSSSTNWLALGNIFRRNALGSYIGATGNSPRPYGMYVQTYHDDQAVDPGEAEIRWQQFAAWTMGYSYVDAFIYTGGNNNFGGQPNGPVYQAFQETARQGRNLGPALTKLISYGYGPSFVAGAGSSGLPGEWINFDRNNAQPAQRYLTGVNNITNLGTKNGGLSGDVYVGFFNPLTRSFGDPVNTTYFMAMNGLGGNLSLPSGQSDNTATVAQTRQQMTLNFDFGITGINSLQRLNRNTGQVDVITTGYSDGGNTILTSLGGGKYQLQLTLDGGTGDLFKYNDGTAFVGAQGGVPVAYWDNDGNAANNDVNSGAGLGGSGTWDSGTPKWFDGTNNAAFTAGSNVVFGGIAGTVSFTAPQSVTSLEFQTTGYTLAGSTLTLLAPTISTAAGVTATINAPIAGSSGLIKNGPGTLNLQSASTYTGNTTINEGVLGISNASLGALPGAPTPNIQINNGATLRFNANNLILSANRQMVMGSGGGVIDTAGNNASIAGTISGSTLTKTGAGTLTLSGANTHSGTAVNGGTLNVAADTGLGTAPATFTTGNVTLDGGALQFGANFDINSNRGITLNAGGGTIDTQSFSNPSGYNAFHGGFTGPGNLTKIGSGTFFASATSGGLNTTWSGNLIIKEGTWKIVATDGLPYNVPNQDGLKAAQVTLDGGTWQIGATINATSARRGVTITSDGGTIDTQNFNLTWAAPWAGSSTSAVLTKIGSGKLQLNSTSTYGPGTYAGTLNVTAGTVQLDGGTAMGDLAALNISNVDAVGMIISGGTETIGSLGGGGTKGGYVSLTSSLVTGGNNSSTVFNGVISGIGSLTKTGTGSLTLGPSSGNLYSGGTTVNAGKLFVNNIVGSGTGGGAVTVNSGGTLGGIGSISGSVAVSGGAHLAPGVTLGTLGVGLVTLGVGSNLDIDLDTVAGVGKSDLLNVTTANGLTINGGMLNIANLGTVTPGTYTIIDYAGTLNGSATNLTLGSTPAGYSFSVANNPANSSIDLTVSATGIPGDFDHSGAVDAADYVVWRHGLGTIYTQSDFDTWRSHFGQTSGGGSDNSTPSAVPEPSLLLLAIGGWPLFMCCRALGIGR